MKIKRYIKTLKPYVCFLVFLSTSQNETNFQTEKIIHKERHIKKDTAVVLDQQNNITTKSRRIINKQEKKQVSFFLVIVGFIVLFIIAALIFPLYNKKKTQLTDTKKEAQSGKIKLELSEQKKKKHQGFMQKKEMIVLKEKTCKIKNSMRLYILSFYLRKDINLFYFIYSNS